MANGEIVTLEVAAAMTAAYRREAGEGAITAHMADKSLVQQILNQRGCEGIRMYHGLEEGEKVIVMVGTDADGQDMTSGIIVERFRKCPPYCSNSSALNG